MSMVIMGWFPGRHQHGPGKVPTGSSFDLQKSL